MRAFTRLACAAALVPLMACASAEFRPRAVANAFAMRGDADAALADARFQFGTGNYALAISGFRRVLREAPASIDAHVGLGQAYDRLGRFDLARRYYEEGLALAPDDPDLRRSYADALRARGLEAEARALDDVPERHAGAIEAMAAMSGASVTIDLPDPLPAEPPIAEPVSVAGPAEAVPRLERMSRAEVALVTVPRPSAPAARIAAREDEARAAPSLPVRLTRNTGRELVWELDPPPPAVHEARPGIRVLNAVGRRGQAARMGQHVRTLGWPQVTVGDASVRRARSRIVCTPDEAAQARRLADSLPFRPHVIVSPDARHLFLVLGRDAMPFDDRLLGRGGAS